MKTSLRISAIVLLVLSATAGVLAQEWSKAQTEVWQVCENNWKAWKAGNIDALAATTHPKYQGWDDQTPLPYTKEKFVEQYKEWKDKISLTSYDIEPARIVVTENAAVIDYYYSYSMTVTQDDKKDNIKRNGMYVEFYVKEKGVWLLLADMTTHKEK
jgi:hypothetical protein